MGRARARGGVRWRRSEGRMTGVGEGGVERRGEKGEEGTCMLCYRLHSCTLR